MDHRRKHLDISRASFLLQTSGHHLGAECWEARDPQGVQVACKPTGLLFPV